jgi:hypothetical protein
MSHDSNSSSDGPTDRPRGDDSQASQLTGQRQRRMSDNMRGALLAAIAALLGAVIGGLASLAGTIVQLQHQDASQVAQLRRSVYQEYLLAEEKLLGQLPTIVSSPGTGVSLKTFLAESKTWTNAPATWQKVADQQDRISLYASDAVLNSVFKCTTVESILASRARSWYKDVLRLSKRNPIAASSLARSVNTDLGAALNRAESICAAVRTQMRSETGIGH